MPVSRRTVTKRPAARRAAPVRRTTTRKTATRKTATRKTTTTRKPATKKRASQGSALEPLGFSMPFRRSSRAAAVPSAAAEKKKKNHTVRNAIIGTGLTAMAVTGALALRNESRRSAAKEYAGHMVGFPAHLYKGAMKRFSRADDHVRDPRKSNTVAGVAAAAAAAASSPTSPEFVI
jgi:hypothetical protein